MWREMWRKGKKEIDGCKERERHIEKHGE